MFVNYGSIEKIARSCIGLEPKRQQDMAEQNCGGVQSRVQYLCQGGSMDMIHGNIDVVGHDDKYIDGK